MRALLGLSLLTAMVLMGARSALSGEQRGGPAGDLVTFENVATAIGVDVMHTNGASPDKYLVETMGSGAVLFDYDHDGWLDLFVVDGGSLAAPAVASKARHRLFHNTGSGTFKDETAASGIQHRDYGMGACAGDVDNDGSADLYITSYGSNSLYRNLGNGSFADTTRTAGVGLSGWSTSCAFLDVDRDGDLDLFVANYLDAPRSNNRFCGDPQRRIRVYCHPLNYMGLPSVLYRNDGTGVFADVSVEAGIATYVGNGLGLAAGDYDDDGWPDVFVANDAVPNFLFHNENGRFREVGLAAGVAVGRDGKARAGMGTEFADYNGDGRLDLVVTNHEFETHSLFRNEGEGTFVDASVEAGIASQTLPFVGFGVALFDADNSGDIDIAIANGHVIDNTALFRPGSSHAQRKLLFRNTTGRRFEEVGRQSGPGFAGQAVGRTLLAGDIDNDGDVDLVFTNNGGSVEVLRNNGGTRRSSLVVRTVGVRSNRDGIGARVTIAAAGRTQVREVKSGASYLGQHDLRVLFGLGDARRVERMDVRWPDGKVETVRDLDVNQIVTVTEGRGVTARFPFRRP
ncbi:MAG TPA: CRTAC1 family protein [Vicinamibacterales bacterium]|nr:CRTAC1 family protein [Vicinamibacterales bacterium]